MLKVDPQLVGILNITKDSFSDGGEYFDPQRAIRKGQLLKKDGASIIDIGAQSSHPDSENVSPQHEIERLTPVIHALKQYNIPISIDTYKPEVMKHVLELGVDMINDITALQEPDAVDIAKEFDVPVVLMFSINQISRAEKTIWKTTNPMNEIISFFEMKIDDLIKKGLKEERLILDPGMGFFIGANPEPSLYVLRNLAKLKTLGRKIFISTSRKSFIGTVLNRTVSERGAGTLATEIWSALQEVDYIRTHDVKALSDAINMIDVIQKSVSYYE